MSADVVAGSEGCSRSPSRGTTARAASSTPSTRTRRYSGGGAPALEEHPDRAALGHAADPPHPAAFDRQVPLRRPVAVRPDGFLYISIGDGGPQEDPNGNGQSLSAFWGKILRIDPNPSRTAAYRIPGGNPFAGSPGARPEIWAYGLRNPWRFSFDSSTGDLTIGDVGYNTVEEVDFAPHATGGGAGANYGWNCYEGRSHPFGELLGARERASGARDQLHCNGFCAIMGGYVVRDASCRPSRPLPLRGPLRRWPALGSARHAGRDR